MNSEFQKYELIEQYLSGALKGEALNNFNAMLKNNPEFKKEVALHKDIEIGLMDKEDIPFIKTLNEIHKKETKILSDKKKNGQSGIIRPLVIVSSIAALFVVGIFISQFLTESTTPLAVSEKLIGEPLAQSKVRSPTKKNEDLDKAFQQIENKNYENAIKILSGLYDSKVNKEETGTALGYCYLQNGQYDKASEIFNELLKNDLNNSDKVNWYLAHNYLRDKQFNKSIEVLENMRNEPIVTYKRKQEAKGLIKQIEKHFL